MKNSANIKTKRKCSNCGSMTHSYNKCPNPIYSYGIINILIEKNGKICEDKKNDIVGKYTSDKKNVQFISNGINYNDMNDIEVFCEYKNCIKFLLVRRKHSLGFYEFIRGRYDIYSPDTITHLFKQMSKEEISRIKTLPFSKLWDEFWGEPVKNNKILNDYKKSEDKFNKLSIKSNEYLTLEFYVNNVKPVWDDLEWGFPKGRKNNGERIYDCALREFKEETGIDVKNIQILTDVNPIHEYFIGTNGVKYGNIYYIGMANNLDIPIIDENNKSQSQEISAIGWFTCEEVLKKIRPYHTEKKKLILQIYMHILNNIPSIDNVDV